MKCKGTFSLNKNKPFYSWYKYDEAYSEKFLFDELKDLNIKSLYDPFGGCGTSMLFASLNNIKSYYSEINPFMNWVIQTKINSSKRLSSCIQELIDSKNKLINLLNSQQDYSCEGLQKNKYYDDCVFSKIIFIKSVINNNFTNKDVKNLFMLALAKNLVEVSNMQKRGDLRFATEKELSTKNKDIESLFLKTVEEYCQDIVNYSKNLSYETVQLSDDARKLIGENLVDCVITSPPYLNGTNYFRNTKLELELLEFVNDEVLLSDLHSKGIAAGINTVSKKRKEIKYRFDFVEEVLENLRPIAYDKRIPIMIESYFDDMCEVFVRLKNILKNDGIFIMDIGDSQFSNIHIPTHEFLEKIANFQGFEKISEEIIRKRKSKNGMILSQRILRFKLNKGNEENKLEFVTKAENFMKKLPYKQKPFESRNWGNKLHSLCSYQGKLKPSIAHFLITEFTKENEKVLDPLCGVGTIPLEACLNGRIGIGNDLSQLAFAVSSAKLNLPSKTEVNLEIDKLENHLLKNSNKYENQSLPYSQFGLNKSLKEYFEHETFKEIILAREYCLNKFEENLGNSAYNFMVSCLLHILHGNRPYALSRTSHPLTPYAPKGEFVYRNLIKHLKDKVNLTYQKLEKEKYKSGKAFLGDYKNLSEKISDVDWIITSPPFVDSLKFYTNNWMRLWFLGWEDEDFKNAKNEYLDDLQQKSLDVYSKFFEMCHKVLKNDGKVIMHLGKSKQVDMAQELSKISRPYFKTVFIGEESVEQVERHGIKDKGGTICHQFLFLTKIN